MTFSEKTIKKVVAISQLFYLILVFVGVLKIISKMEMSTIFTIIAFSVRYYGLGWKKPWAVLLETINSAIFLILALIITALTGFLTFNSSQTWLLPAAGLIGVGINGFLLYFFTSKKVKEYFNYTFTIKYLLLVSLFLFVELLLPIVYHLTK